MVPLLNVNNYGYLWAQCKSITSCSHKCDNLVITTFFSGLCSDLYKSLTHAVKVVHDISSS